MPQEQGIGLLEQILKALTQALQAGLAEVHPVVAGYVTLFTAFALILTCYGIIAHGRAFHAGISFLVRGALVVWAVENWPWFLEQLSRVAVGLGLLLTGSTLTARTLLDPGVLLQKGLDSAAPIWEAYTNNASWYSPSGAMMGLAYFAIWLIYLGAFGVAVWRLFWIQTEMLLASAAGVVLLPTLLFRPVQFVATGVLSYAANAFSRFLVVSMLAGLLWRHLDKIPMQVKQAASARLDLSLQEAVLSAAIAVVLAACFLASNALAGTLTSGIPGMAGAQHFGQVVSGISGGISALMTAGGGAVTGGLGIARGIAATSQAAVGAGQAARSLPAGAGPVEAVRQLYAGARTGMSGGAQQRLGELMGSSASFTQRQGGATLARLMGQHGPPDRAHGGSHFR